MVKELIKDRDVLIISFVLLLAVSVQLVGNEIESYKEINAELLEDLKYEETKASAYLYAFEDEKNKVGQTHPRTILAQAFYAVTLNEQKKTE